MSDSDFEYTQCIQDSIDESIDSLNQWAGELKVDCLENDILVKDCNIMECTQSTFGLIPTQIYFPLSLFSIENGYHGKGFKDLKQYLEIAAIKNGCTIISNGGTNVKLISDTKHYRMFKCSHGIKYQGDLKKRQSMKYRNVSYSNDRRNNRSKGKTLPRRSQTCKPCSSTEKCPFSLQISFDVNGFYVVNGKGNHHHVGHPFIKDSSAIHSARHLSDEEKEIAASIINSDASHGVVKNVINTRTGLCLTVHNVAYLSNMLSDLKLSPDCKDLSNADNLIKYLKHNKYDFLCMSSKNRKDKSGPILSTDNNIPSRNIFTHSEYVLPPDEYADATYFSKHHREKMKLSHHQNLLISVAWVIPSEREYFSRFPQVLFIDATAQTNNERRPLLLICGKDAKGKMFPVLRAFLPNERAWVFRWVFNVALPSLFSKSVLEKVNIIVSDGDSQEYSQIDICINNHIRNASRVRCGWHLVDKYWNKSYILFYMYTDTYALNMGRVRRDDQVHVDLLNSA